VRKSRATRRFASNTSAFPSDGGRGLAARNQAATSLDKPCGEVDEGSESLFIIVASHTHPAKKKSNQPIPMAGIADQIV